MPVLCLLWMKQSGELLVSDIPDRLRSMIRPCRGIMGREDYFQSAVLVPLIQLEESWHLLFQVRAANIRQGDEICFPGGGFDPDKDRSFQDTALRETYEELGIKRESIELLGPLDTLITPMDVLVEPYLAILHISSLSEMEISRDEVASIFTIPLDELEVLSFENYQVRMEMHPFSINPEDGRKEIHFPGRDLNLPERYHDSWGNQMHNILAYRSHAGTIWGITARILKEFITLLQE